MDSGSLDPDEFPFLILNNCFETFPATEDSAYNGRPDLGRADYYPVYKREFLDIFCADSSEGGSLREPSKPGEDFPNMFCVFRVFHAHLGGGGGARVGDEIVRLLNNTAGKGRVE